jgi:adenylate kinase
VFHIITGSPGTGKHTISRLLAATLHMPVVDTTRAAVEAGLAGPEGTDTDALARVIGRPSGDALLVGHLAPHVAAPDVVRSATVLRRSPYELEAVYRRRGYARSKAMANLGAEILDVVAGEAAAAFGRITQVDVTGDTPEDSARKVAGAMRGAYPSDVVDWLGAIHHNGDVPRFFELDK